MSARRRPAWVPREFAGRARVFPDRDTLLLSYQRRWVEDQALMKLMEKGRRIGISYASAYERVRAHADEARRLDSWVSSRDEPTARLVIRDCKAFARVLQVAAEDLGERVLDEAGSSGHVLAFANSTRINSVASNPDVFAGKGGDVLLDELALRNDPRGVYSIAAPTIDWGGRLAIISTHRGTGNYFNELVAEIVHKGNPKGFSHHKVTLRDALDAGFLYKLQRTLRPGDPRLELDEAAYYDYQRSRCADEETFLQEYQCVPGDDQGAFIEYALIDACKYRPGTPEAGAWSGREWSNGAALPRDADAYVGVDVGRRRDLTVIWVLRKVAGQFLSARVIELAKTPFATQERILASVLDDPRVRRCCIDETGLGMHLAENAARRFGHRVETVTLTAAAKEDMAHALRAQMEDLGVRIPDDASIAASLRGVRKEVTSAGNVRFVGERGGEVDGHCDHFWALALALHAGLRPRAPFAWARLPGGRRERSRRPRAGVVL